MHHKLPYKKQLMVMPLVSCSFLWSYYGKAVIHKLVCSVNDFNVILYGHPMIFNVFLEIFSTNNFQFLIKIVPRDSKVLKTQRECPSATFID